MTARPRPPQPTTARVKRCELLVEGEGAVALRAEDRPTANPLRARVVRLRKWRREVRGGIDLKRVDGLNFEWVGGSGLLRAEMSAQENESSGPPPRDRV